MSLPVFQGPVKKVMKNLVINIFRFPLSVFSDRGKSLVRVSTDPIRCTSLAIAVKILQHFWPDFMARSPRYSRCNRSDCCHQLLGVFGRISRGDKSDHTAIMMHVSKNLLKAEVY